MEERQLADDGIDTGSNLAFEARFWTFQRLSWGLLACLVAAGLAGGFGRGFLSAATLPFSNGGDIEFEKLIRFKTPTSYMLNVRRTASGPTAVEEVRVNVGSGLLEKLNLKIGESTPAVASVEGYPGGMVLVFKPAAGAEAFQIKLTFEPKAIGSLRGQLGLSGSAPLEIEQFVYP
jgi:hypothetical protein